MFKIVIEQSFIKALLMTLEGWHLDKNDLPLFCNNIFFKNCVVVLFSLYVLLDYFLFEWVNRLLFSVS